MDQLCILAQIPDCAFLDVRIFGPKRTFAGIINLSSALVGMLMSSSELFPFSNKAHLNSGVRLLLESYYVKVFKHVAFFTICAKLLVTMAFTFTFLDVIVVSDLKKNIV